MKTFYRFFGLLVLLVMMCTIAPESAYSQIGNMCDPCITMVWNGPYSQNIQLPGGCWIKVKYRKRTGCGIWKEVDILSIEKLTPQCALYTTAELYSLGIKELLKLNPMNFPPPPGACAYNFRVTQPACATWGRDVFGDSVTVPCDSSVCCVRYYEICTSMSGVRTVRFAGAEQAAPCDSTDFHCSSVCGINDSIETDMMLLPDRKERDASYRMHPGSDELEAVSSSSSGHSQAMVTAVRPNPTIGNTSFEFQVSAAGAVKLALYDATGREVARLTDENYQPGRYTLLFRGNDLPNGNYIYKLTTSSGTESGTLVISH